MAHKTKSASRRRRSGRRLGSASRNGSVSALLEGALDHHRSGDFQEAESLYRRILADHPDHPEALHLIGTLFFQTGRSAAAVEPISRAIALDGTNAMYHSNLASALMALGRFDEAVETYRRAIRLNPRFSDARNNLGVALRMQGKVGEAEECYREAARLDPNNADAFYNLGKILQERGQVAEAAENFRRTVRIKAEHVAAHRNLGIMLKEMEELDAALESFRRSVQLAPDDALAHFGMGVTLHEQKKFDEAAESFRRTIRLRPEYAEAHYGLGVALKEERALDAALESYREALRLRPDYAEAHVSLGDALRKKEMTEEAVESYREALRLMPENTEARIGLAVLFKDQGKLDEAFDIVHEALRWDPGSAEAYWALGALLRDQGKLDKALESIREAIRLKPDSTKARLGMGHLLTEKRDLNEAAECFRETVRLDPREAGAHWGLGVTLLLQGKYSEGMRSYRDAFRIDPTDGKRVHLATTLPVIYASHEELRACRAHLEEGVEELLREGLAIADPMKDVGSTNFYLAYQGYNDRNIQEKIARLYSSQHVSCSAGRSPGDRLRVGFISKNFRNHTIGRLMLGVTAHFDRERFETVVLSVGEHEDNVSQRFRQYADRYVQVPENLPAARELIAGLDLDVLFYADIGMEPFTYFLAYSRLAPVQCVTWGHPVTTGIKTIDYFISSRSLEPEGADRHYTEELVLLNAPPTYYIRPSGFDVLKPRSAYGLPEDEHLYLCPQSLFKYHPDFDEILGGILRRDPRGRLALVEAHCANWNDILMGRFRRTIPDVTDRIQFLPRQRRDDFVNLMAVSDVMLDTVHFTGGNTSLEGFAFGTPIVTLPGEFMRGRVTHAYYQQMGMMDCVASTPEEYVEIAVRLGTDCAYRESVKEKILDLNHVLYKNIAVVRELEAFFVDAVERACERAA